MAQIIKKNSELKREMKRCQLKLMKGWTVCGLSIVLLLLDIISFHVHSLLGYVLLVIVMCISGKYCKQVANQCEILRAGLEGESVATKMISKCLPKSYYVFQNMKVTYDGKTSEMDMVVVGKTGVYIVEIKNHKGTIVGKQDAQYWEQKKRGEGGTTYSKEFYSPVKQVGTHVYRLAHYLRENGIRVHVESIVYFSNPEAIVHITNGKTGIPVFVEADNGGLQMAFYIKDRETTLSNKVIKKIYKLLRK